MGFPIDVVVFINEATETSIPLEIAGKIDNDDDFSVTIYSFFEPEGTTFGYDVCSLDATSQFDLRAYRRLYRRLREENPDVFHVHPNATGSIARILSTVADVPHVVTTEHNSHREFGHLKNLLNGGTNWLNERVICNSQSTANSFSSWENKLLKLVGTNKEVVYNGVDLERIKTSISRRPPPELPDKFIVGTAGRLVHQKNHQAIIKSVSRLGDDSDVHAAIVGKGPQKEYLETLSHNLGIEDNVEFLGYLPERADVYAFFDNIDVFVFPSLYEGFGVAVVEAMATGTAVIVNDLPVMREVADDAALFVDTNDAGELAAALEELYDDDQKRRSLEERGKEMVRERFPLKRTLQQYRDLYKELVSG